MFRTTGSPSLEPKTINCVLMDGGIGDHIGGSLIAVNYILTQYPWMNIKLWLPDMLKDFAGNVLNHQNRLFIGSYSDMQTLDYDPNLTTINTKWDGRFSPMKVHTTDYAFRVLCDENPDLKYKTSLKINPNPIKIKQFNLPKSYVVLLTGYTALVREFNPNTVNALAQYIKSKGYIPIYLGETKAKTGAQHVIETSFSEKIDFSGLNLINQTSLLQAAKIMQNAKAVVGVDCGLLHVAACTDIPIVAGYTTVRPELRAPIRLNGEIPTLGHNWYPITPGEALGCRFCQSNTNFIYDHDYRFCMYKDYACTKDLTVNNFITHLDKIL